MERAQLLAAQAEVALKAPVTRSSGWTDRWCCCAPSGIFGEPPGLCPHDVVAAPRHYVRIDHDESSKAPSTTRLCFAPEARPRSRALLTGAASAPDQRGRGGRDGATLPIQTRGARRGCYDGCRRTRRLSRSRRLTIPTNAVPATTGRWRNPLPSMISAARSEST